MNPIKTSNDENQSNALISHFLDGPPKNAAPDGTSAEAPDCSVSSPQKRFYAPFIFDDPEKQVEMAQMVQAANKALEAPGPDAQNNHRRSHQAFYAPIILYDNEMQAELEQMVEAANETLDHKKSAANPSDAANTMHWGVPAEPFQASLWTTIGPVCDDAPAGISLEFETLSTRGQPASNECTLMEKATSQVPFVSWRNEIYIFNGLCYEHQNPKDVESAILELCRDDVFRIGRYVAARHILQSGYTKQPEQRPVV